jgi:diazepam-binding inhibitor (GABA receptor modulator, acyl-CoA-binding protein)
MSDLKTRFEQAQAESKLLPKRPDNQKLLEIYSLFKQATEGDNSGKRPGFTDLVGRAKFDAWKTLEGTSKDEAMERYIKVIESLK